HPAERHQGGLGIGLALVEGLVRLHGGTVEARSAGLGQGSEFIVRLPRPQPGAPPEGDDPVDTAPQGLEPSAPIGPRVLLVEDNEDGAAMLAELLRMMGCEVRVADDGASALALLGAAGMRTPDVVLLDIGLPDMNGYEVARRIRAMPHLAQPRLIALTGWGQEEDKKLAAQAGFDDHWTKPVDPARLQQLVDR
ncbi:MAG TPA: response regulator, partial [Ramlibacter sp.]|nr:response regulator [Ramlibacter sp.]